MQLVNVVVELVEIYVMQRTETVIIMQGGAVQNRGDIILN